MTVTPNKVNRPPTAPLRNVTLFLELVERQIAQPMHMTRLGVFFGPSGYGKTKAAVYAANKNSAYTVECGSRWTAKTLVDALLHELTGKSFRGSVADKVDEIIQVLAIDPRPLIIDEADHLVKKSIIDIVREIHDKSITPVILIGEEQLPHKLAEFERTHNRVSSWVPAEPADITDARALAAFYYPQLDIEDPVLEMIINEVRGVTRRIVDNLQRLHEGCQKSGNLSIKLGDMDENDVFTGPPPQRRLPTVARRGKAA